MSGTFFQAQLQSLELSAVVVFYISEDLNSKAVSILIQSKIPSLCFS